MSNFSGKLKNFFGLEAEEQENRIEEKAESRVERNAYIPEESSSSYVAPERQKSSSFIKPSYARENTHDPKMVICKYSPLDHRESTAIIDDIRNGRPVILNFEETEDYVAAKIINICEGASYALNADISKIANEIFIVVPNGIDILNNVTQNKSEYMGSETE